jgi:hypothetical protein
MPDPVYPELGRSLEPVQPQPPADPKTVRDLFLGYLLQQMTPAPRPLPPQPFAVDGIRG